MMTGRITNEELRLDVSLIGPDGDVVVVNCVVDTGFQGALVLPPSVIKRLKCPFIQRLPSQLADGSSCHPDSHFVDILWHSKVVHAVALAMGDRPLVGTALLVGNDIRIRYEEGGWFQMNLLSPSR